MFTADDHTIFKRAKEKIAIACSDKNSKKKKIPKIKRPSEVPASHRRRAGGRLRGAGQPAEPWSLGDETENGGACSRE